MKKANIATLRAHLSDLLEYVLKGNELEIQKRNITIAKVVPTERLERNKTKLGAGKNTVKFYGKLTDPFMPEKDWEMLKSK